MARPKSVSFKLSKEKKRQMIIQIKANQDELIKWLIKHCLPLSSNKMFSGFISLWVIPTLCRYSCQSVTGNLVTAETHRGCQINCRVLSLTHHSRYKLLEKFMSIFLWHPHVGLFRERRPTFNHYHPNAQQHVNKQFNREAVETSVWPT